jgi:hypothetical protein
MFEFFYHFEGFDEGLQSSGRDLVGGEPLATLFALPAAPHDIRAFLVSIIEGARCWMSAGRTFGGVLHLEQHQRNRTQGLQDFAHALPS